MIQSIRRLFRHQRGFTLVEILVAVAITAILIAAMAAVFIQVVRINQSNDNRLTAVRNLDIAGNWFIRDFQPAQMIPASTTFSPGSGQIIVTQSVAGPSDTAVTYSIDSKGNLLRTVGTNKANVAQHISNVVYTAGTAVAPSIANVTATVGSITVTKSYSIASRISDSTTVLTITTTSLPSGVVGVAYDETLAAYSGNPPYTWSIINGSLSPGLGPITTSGEIQGTPTTVGTSNFTVQVKDSSGTIATESLSITIIPAPPDHYSVSSISSPRVVGTAFSVTVQALDAHNNPTTSSEILDITFGKTDTNATPTSVTTVSGTATFSITMAVVQSGQSITFTGQDSGAIGTSNTFTVNPGSIDHYSVSSVSSPQNHGTAFNVTIQAQDVYNNNITSGAQAAESINITFAKADAGATPTSTSTSAGTKTVSMKMTVAQTSQQITFTGATSHKAGTTNVFAVLGTPYQLAFTTSAQTNITVGKPSNVITVQVQDINSSPVNVTASTQINLTSSSGTGSFSLSATTWSNVTSMTISSGNNSGSFYYKDTTVGSPTITVASSGLIGATQTETVNPGAAYAVTFTTPPASTGSVDSPLTTQPVIHVADQYGNNAADGVTVTASIFSGAGTLLGTVTQNTSGGTGNATFINLGYNKIDIFTIQFTANGHNINSGNLSMSAGAAYILMINTQPAGTSSVDNALTTQPIIHVVDQYNNNVADGTTVTASIVSGTGTLRNVTVNTAGGAGLATFSGLGYSKSGETFNLKFSANGHNSATSSNIGPLTVGTKSKLVWGTQPPTSVADNVTWPSFIVAITDQFGNQTTSTDSITITPSSGSLGGTVTKAAVSGLATFSNITDTTPGTITLTASATGLTSTPPSNTISINPVITATAAQFGNITPSGTVVVVYGQNQSFTISGQGNHHVTGVIVDGVNQGVISSYTFNNVVANHAISYTTN